MDRQLYIKIKKKIQIDKYLFIIIYLSIFNELDERDNYLYKSEKTIIQ